MDTTTSLKNDHMPNRILKEFIKNVTFSNRVLFSLSLSRNLHLNSEAIVRMNLSGGGIHTPSIKANCKL